MGVCLPLVLFLDMDYFFAACEELRHPELKSRPFVVGTATIAKKERGVVQTCNYEARKFGIHSAMPTAKALRLKPDLVYLESDDDYYQEVSDRVMGLLKGYGFATEVISVDEAALALGGMGYDEAEKLARKMKERIKKELGLPCTVGVSTGKVYAKMACDSAKPDGIRILKEGELKQFLNDSSIGALLGVGRKTADRLKGMGVQTIGQLARADPNVLVENFGSFGRELFLLANGRDESRIEENYAVLSIGRERTLDSETNDHETIANMLRTLSKEVIGDVKKKGLWFRGVSVKAKYTDFTERIKNRRLRNYTDSLDILYDTAAGLIVELEKGKRIRKVGVRTYILDAKKGQRSIF